jgi:hypothetical protein
MRKNKSNMYTVQGYKQNGNPAELLIEESVDFCPFCLRTQNLNRENVFVIDNPFEAASIVYRCNTRDCQNPFLVKYECDPMDGIYKVHSIYPQQKFRRRTFPDAVENISPAFVSIYNEALSAENSNLKEVAGAGYRKALEFLIKDYCISEKNAEENKVKSSPLMRCIEDHIDKMVGPTGFEPATPTTPRWCATRLRHGPTACCVFSRSWSVCHAFVKIRAVAQILSI